VNESKAYLNSIYTRGLFQLQLGSSAAHVHATYKRNIYGMLKPKTRKHDLNYSLQKLQL